MKTSYLTLLTASALLLISHTGFAQICKPNIANNWQNIRYLDKGDGTVLDRNTNLIWKKCSEGLSGTDCATGSATFHNWQQALILADGATFAGKSDWRLPNIKELSSLAARNCRGPAINETLFPNTPASNFWSSSPHSNDSYYAWNINFGYGKDYYNYRYDYNRVRLVRDGQ